jgi:uncharacterized protein (TIGR02147 family)
MIVFEYQDYKKYALDRLKSSQDRGRGQLTKIAKHLRVPLSTISLVFHGERDFTPDQASDLCIYFGLTEHETDYFLCLVDFSRASTKSLKENLQRRIAAIKKDSSEVKNIVVVDKVLNQNEKFIFYSDWYYSAIRLLTSVEEVRDPSDIAQRLGISIKRVSEVLQFLLSSGLCIQVNGRIKMGPRSTHIGAEDPLVFRHHRNWRELALSRLTSNQKLEPSEASLTYPCSISEAAMQKIKKELLLAIEKIDSEMERSSEDLVAYLNLDFFKLAEFKE